MTLLLRTAVRMRGRRVCDLTIPPPEGAVVADDYIPMYKHDFNGVIRLLGHSEIPERALAIAKEVRSLYS